MDLTLYAVLFCTCVIITDNTLNIHDYCLYVCVFFAVFPSRLFYFYLVFSLWTLIKHVKQIESQR